MRIIFSIGNNVNGGRVCKCHCIATQNVPKFLVSQCYRMWVTLSVTQPTPPPPAPLVSLSASSVLAIFKVSPQSMPV